MGAGKTTVGRRCAERLGRPFVDTDDLVHDARPAMPVAEFFATRGEAAFRALERQAVADVCASPEPLVIACGGGAVARPREPAAPPRRRRRRVAAGAGRGARGVASATGATPAAARRRSGRCAAPARRGSANATYEAAAHATVDTDGRDVDAVADAVLAVFARSDESRDRTRSASISARAATTSSSATARCDELATLLAGRRRVAVVSRPRSSSSTATRGAVRRSSGPGIEHETFIMGDGEDAKTLATVEHLCRAVRASGACCAATRSSRSAAASSATPPASRPRCTTAASTSCRYRRRCSRWSTPRSAARPA